jgi:hypothetical protein
MKASLKDAPAVALSTDGVHLSAQGTHYDAYDAVFVEQKTFTPQRLVLTVVPPPQLQADTDLSQEDRAKAAASRLVDVCREFGISGKISAITTDGPSVMSKWRGGWGCAVSSADSHVALPTSRGHG